MNNEDLRKSLLESIKSDKSSRADRNEVPDFANDPALQEEVASSDATWTEVTRLGRDGPFCVQSNEQLASMILRSSMTRSVSPAPCEPAEAHFQRVTVGMSGNDPTDEEVEVATLMVLASALRKKYVYEPNNEAKSFCNTTHAKEPPVDTSDYIVNGEDGIWRVYKNEAAMDKGEEVYDVVEFADYAKDLYQLLRVCAYGPCKTFAYKRLQLLEAKFRFHTTLNSSLENSEQKSVPHRDFYNIRKVDGHVHHTSSMNQKHLLNFIKKKLKTAGDEKVIIRDGKTLTLKEVFESLNLTAYELSVDTLDVHAHNDTFHRFDKFNLKYNPCGQSRLREIFLKSNNYIKGKYLAEITQELIAELHDTKYQMAEYRVSIYGRSKEEWDRLADWILGNDLLSPNVRWMIQTPRLFSVYKATGTPGIESFHDLLRNIFEPLFQVTLKPESNPKLAKLLEHITGFDSVDDESKRERLIQKGIPSPSEWTTHKNPPFTYQMYYTYTNLYRLNCLRQEMGLNTFSFRPHCGEAGGTDHLACSLMLANSINHGIMLRKTPVLQYLFYVEQVGMAMSPLSNNALFLSYNTNPFYNFFERGLNVTLSTDDPLQFHYSKEPLIEEYSVAKAVWKLTSCDLSEIARNSVLQSNFEHVIKEQWLGPGYYKQGVDGNMIHKTNVPQIRVAFRHETLLCERRELRRLAESNTLDIEAVSDKLNRW